MSMTTRDLLEEYRHAGLNRRLHLYLQYPDLRPEFTEMDRSMARALNCVKGARCIPACTLKAKKPGWARRLFGMKARPGAAGV